GGSRTSAPPAPTGQPSLYSAPEGRSSVARGVSPWNSGSVSSPSPGGAAVPLRRALPFCRPFGAGGGEGAAVPGPARRAHGGRPSGAKRGCPSVTERGNHSTTG